jgi:Arc/MetJ-type ribon-helix-helix transcriptional regulator
LSEPDRPARRRNAMTEPEDTLIPGDVTYESKGDTFRERRSSLEDFKSSVKEFAQKLPGQIGKAIETIQARMNAITVQVDDETQQKIDSLVEAGIFKNRSESAAYLIHEGIRARAEVFAAIDDRLAEIDRMRTQLRELISESHEPK